MCKLSRPTQVTNVLYNLKFNHTIKIEVDSSNVVVHKIRLLGLMTDSSSNFIVIILVNRCDVEYVVLICKGHQYQILCQTHYVYKK